MTFDERVVVHRVVAYLTHRRLAGGGEGRALGKLVEGVPELLEGVEDV